MNKYTTVPEFLTHLDVPKLKQVELLRSLIQAAHPGLIETIKWNAPSYALDGEDRITFNLQNKAGEVKLVLHMGATRTEDKNGEPIMPDDTGLIAWQSDIRGILSFADTAGIEGNQAEISAIIKRWLAIPPA